MTGIYLVLNKITNKIYIGSAVNLSKRFTNHQWALKNNRHKNSHLQNSFNLYKAESFEFIILEYCDSESLLIREQLYIDCVESSCLYNICLKAGNTLGKKLSEETKLKISQKASGRKHTEEHKSKISLTSKGRIVSESTKEKHRRCSAFQPNNFLLVNPLGEIVSGNNIKLFCKENNLNPAHISSVIKGRRKHHKDWRKIENG